MNDTNLPSIALDSIRDEIAGSCFRFRTTFGERLMVYADYTASGRNVHFIERYLMKIQDSYANTHTEDDETGRSTTEMLHAAEATIKNAVNGNEDTRIIAAGSGATGAIEKLQQILGVYMPPATKEWLKEQSRRFRAETGSSGADEYFEFIRRNRPVIFVGPYEHHSNEISWRESIGEVHEIGLHPNGGIDLDDLEKKVGSPEFDGRIKIGSFSAASNVTGVRTPVYDVARILHRHGALACFDFAACAPYSEIDMNRDDEAYFDAIVFSPHKFLGGPGSSGILFFNRRIYRSDLPPCFSAGGTVDYVAPHALDYTEDIEAREKPGTPGTLQVMKAALAVELKEAIGVETIETREKKYIKAAIDRFVGPAGIEILGNPDPENQLAISSFNVRDGENYLHPKLVTRLLNDLFGIQSRAGCSCAGPYGHYLLNIGTKLSEKYRSGISEGYQGIKPGWVRVGFHYTMDEIDFEFVCSAIEFVAKHGHVFISLYHFDLKSGTWYHESDAQAPPPAFGLHKALETESSAAPAMSDDERRAEYVRYMEEEAAIAARLKSEKPGDWATLPAEIEGLKYFRVQHVD